MPDAFAEGASAFAGARLIDGGVRGRPGRAERRGRAGRRLPRRLRLAVPRRCSAPATTRRSAPSSAARRRRQLDRRRTAGRPRRNRRRRSPPGGSCAAARAASPSQRAAGRRRRRTAGAERARAAVRSAACGLGGSGLGDAIVAWRQGTGAERPDRRRGRRRPARPLPRRSRRTAGSARRRCAIHWNAAEQRDRRPALLGQRRRRADRQEDEARSARGLKSGRIGDGRHRIQVFAIDDAGQETGCRNGGRCWSIASARGPAAQAHGAASPSSSPTVACQIRRQGPHGEGLLRRRRAASGGARGADAISAARRQGQEEADRVDIRHAYERGRHLPGDGHRTRPRRQQDRASAARVRVG